MSDTDKQQPIQHPFEGRASPQRAYPNLRFAHVILAALVAFFAVSLFWFKTNYIPARSALARARRAYCLHKVGSAVLEYDAINRKLPATVEDLKSLLDDQPDAWQGLSTGRIVLDFQSLNAIKPGQHSETIIGHESRLSSQSGYVLMGDGTVHELSPIEFQEKKAALD